MELIPGVFKLTIMILEQVILLHTQRQIHIYECVYMLCQCIVEWPILYRFQILQINDFLGDLDNLKIIASVTHRNFNSI
jgi:hypothetical protein